VLFSRVSGYRPTLEDIFTGGARWRGKMHEKCTKNARKMHEKCTKNARKMHEKCTKNARKMHEKCTKNAGVIATVATARNNFPPARLLNRRSENF
jgi:hypothetical protein